MIILLYLKLDCYVCHTQYYRRHNIKKNIFCCLKIFTYIQITKEDLVFFPLGSLFFYKHHFAYFFLLEMTSFKITSPVH